MSSMLIEPISLWDKSVNIVSLVKGCKINVTLQYLEKLHKEAKTEERKMAIEFLIKQIIPRLPDEY